MFPIGTAAAPGGVVAGARVEGHLNACRGVTELGEEDVEGAVRVAGHQAGDLGRVGDEVAGRVDLEGEYSRWGGDSAVGLTGDEQSRAARRPEERLAPEGRRRHEIACERMERHGAVIGNGHSVGRAIRGTAYRDAHERGRHRAGFVHLTVGIGVTVAEEGVAGWIGVVGGEVVGVRHERHVAAVRADRCRDGTLVANGAIGREMNDARRNVADLTEVPVAVRVAVVHEDIGVVAGRARMCIGGIEVVGRRGEDDPSSVGADRTSVRDAPTGGLGAGGRDADPGGTFGAGLVEYAVAVGVADAYEGVTIAVRVAGEDVSGVGVEQHDVAVARDVDERGVAVAGREVGRRTGDREAVHDRGRHCARLVEYAVGVGVAIAHEHVGPSVHIADDEVRRIGLERDVAAVVAHGGDRATAVRLSTTGREADARGHAQDGVAHERIHDAVRVVRDETRVGRGEADVAAVARDARKETCNEVAVYDTRALAAIWCDAQPLGRP